MNIYGPNDVAARQRLWKTLLSVKNDYVNPWCIRGDFNEIRTLGEMQGMDLPLMGKNYTWSNSQGSERWSRIDRFLLHPEWMEVFKVVKKSGEYNIIEGWAGFRVFRKMKELKGKLKEWNYSVFGNIHDKVKSIEDQLHSLDLVAENNPLNDADILKRKELKSELWSALKRAEWLWHQKLRVDWALKGYQNTTYFHIIANGRQRRNFLNSIMVEDISVENPDGVKLAVLNHFKSVFSEKLKKRPYLEGNFGSVISEDMNRLLVENFSEKEIWSAIKSYDGNKAPGSDGFNMLCLRKCWKIMKGILFNFLQNFMLIGNFLRA
ncbi:uncharacterized protein LOC114272897 [Camellia sinensis]|uniref:uncharacterized protein LOC114272897 n=1 Tax=Camellia sinensis TaxID=4442 RepID=UPI0010357EAB|nr:uncharacterized protein LOC114272897 [Camellia sinensis]